MINIWIRVLNPATSRLYDEDVADYEVEFSENGTANVPKDVAESFIEHYDFVIEYHSDD